MFFTIDLNVLPVLFLGILDMLAILAAHWFKRKKLVILGAAVMWFLWFVALTLKK